MLNIQITISKITKRYYISSKVLGRRNTEREKEKISNPKKVREEEKVPLKVGQKEQRKMVGLTLNISVTV